MKVPEVCKESNHVSEYWSRDVAIALNVCFAKRADRLPTNIATMIVLYKGVTVEVHHRNS